jgi:hypothetical protein
MHNTINTITLEYCVLCGNHRRRHTHAPMKRLGFVARILRPMVAALIALISIMGCTTPTSPIRLSEAEFAQANSELRTPVLPESITLKVGEVYRFKKPANTLWWSANQSILMLGQKDGDMIVTALKPGRAQICGKNVFFHQFSQFTTVSVSL